MIERTDAGDRRRRRRADAKRSIAAILDAAARVLGERPDASIEEIADAAGVTRQTVYAHYASRATLFSAMIDHVTAEVVAGMDAAKPDEGPPTAALLRLLDSNWRTIEHYPVLFHADPMAAEESHDRHRRVLDRFEKLIRRGQDAGDFDRDLSPAWLTAAVIALSHAAGEEVGAGRMTAEDARLAVRRSVLRVLGADGQRTT